MIISMLVEGYQNPIEFSKYEVIICLLIRNVEVFDGPTLKVM